MAKKPEPLVTNRMDDYTRKLVRGCATLDEAIRMNPHGYGTVEAHAWSSLVRAKWAINHNEQVLLSRKS